MQANQIEEVIAALESSNEFLTHAMEEGYGNCQVEDQLELNHQLIEKYRNSLPGSEQRALMKCTGARAVTFIEQRRDENGNLIEVSRETVTQ